MNIDRLLEIVALVTWTIFIIAGTIIFIQTLRRRGLGVALRNLFSARMILPLLFPVFISILSAALVFIEPPQVGVVISIVSPAGVRHRPMPSGLHWIIPLAERVERYPIFWQTYTMSGKPLEGEMRGDDAIVARTADGQEVILDCSIIFRIDPNDAIRVHIDWQNRYMQDLLRPLVRGLVRRWVSIYTVDEVNSERRQDLETSLNRDLKVQLAEQGFILDQFLLRNIAFSPEYAGAVEFKQVSLQEVTRKEHEADQIRRLAAGQADEVRILAAAEAEAILVKAQAQAEALRLISGVLEENRDLLTYEYVNKLSPAMRAMLLPANAPLILPLPELAGGAGNIYGQPAAEPLTPTLSISETESLAPRPTLGP